MLKLWNRLRMMNQKKAVILMYHQVCEKRCDPWQLAVDPERFAAHLRMLKRDFEVVSMEHLAHCVANQKIDKNMVAITFDDGFADNYTHAFPLLEWYGLPATFYLTTHTLLYSGYYWWDALQSVILHNTHLPPKLHIMIGKEFLDLSFRRTSTLTPKLIREINAWSYGMPVTNERVSAYLKLWESMKPLPYLEQQEILKHLRLWASADFFNCRDGATMQVYQVKKLIRNPLFSIGAHTVNHAMLAAHPAGEQKFEIHESKRIIEALVGKTVSSFSYPYGNYNALTKSLLRTCGIQYAVSTDASPVTANADPLALPRLQVKNWSAENLSFNIRQLYQQSI